MEALAFWIFALVAVAAAAAFVFHKNPISSALSLVVVLFCTSALYVLLEATFLAVIQIMVYAGAIMILFVFVIMLLNLRAEELGFRHHKLQKVVGFVFCAGLLAQFVAAALAAPSAALATLPADFGQLERVAWLLYTDYLLAFQATAILLLSGVVGAVVVAKKKF